MGSRDWLNPFMLPETFYMCYTCSWGTKSLTYSRFLKEFVTPKGLEFIVLLGHCLLDQSLISLIHQSRGSGFAFPRVSRFRFENWRQEWCVGLPFPWASCPLSTWITISDRKRSLCTDQDPSLAYGGPAQAPGWAFLYFMGGFLHVFNRQST